MRVLRIPHRPEREKLNQKSSAGGATGTAEIRPCTRPAACLFGNQRNLCGATGSHQQGRRDRQQDGQLVPVPPVFIRAAQALSYILAIATTTLSALKSLRPDPRRTAPVPVSGTVRPDRQTFLSPIRPYIPVAVTTAKRTSIQREGLPALRQTL